MLEALRAARPLDEIVCEAGGRNLGSMIAAAEEAGVRLRFAAREELDHLAHGVLHQGVIARVGPFAYTDLARFTAPGLVVVLDNVTDPQNFGAIARSALQAGADALVVPKKRSAQVGPAAEKASAGALSWLPVVAVPNLVRALTDLAEQGVWSVGLDGGASETIWESRLLDGQVAVVVGAEGRGLSRLLAERVDAQLRIPMAGPIDSLNVSVAAALTLFEAARRRA